MQRGRDNRKGYIPCMYGGAEAAYHDGHGQDRVNARYVLEFPATMHKLQMRSSPTNEQRLHPPYIDAPDSTVQR